MAARMTTYTTYDQELLEELQWVISRAIDPSVARRERAVALVWSVCAFLMSVLAQQRGAHPALVALLFVVGLYFAARVLKVYRSMARKAWMDMDKSLTRTDYLLDKSHIVASNAKSQQSFPYSQCERLLETEGHLYFILSSGEGLILDKSHLTGGTASDLRTWLESKSGKRAEQVDRRFKLDLPKFQFPNSGPPRLR